MSVYTACFRGLGFEGEHRCRKGEPGSALAREARFLRASRGLASSQGGGPSGCGCKWSAHTQWPSQELHSSSFAGGPVVSRGEDALPHEKRVSSSFPSGTNSLWHHSDFLLLSTPAGELRSPLRPKPRDRTPSFSRWLADFGKLNTTSSVLTSSQKPSSAGSLCCQRLQV